MLQSLKLDKNHSAIAANTLQHQILVEKDY